MKDLTWLQLFFALLIAVSPFAALDYWLRARKHKEGGLMVEPQPIDMILYCPSCGALHVDKREVSPTPPDGVYITHFDEWGPVWTDDVHREITWDNPPHRSHLCHECGCVWRPADVPTNGVSKLTTNGKSDFPVTHHAFGKKVSLLIVFVMLLAGCVKTIAEPTAPVRLTEPSGMKNVDRVVDKEFGVACYLTYAGTGLGQSISCVKVAGGAP